MKHALKMLAFATMAVFVAIAVAPTAVGEESLDIPAEEFKKAIGNARKDERIRNLEEEAEAVKTENDELKRQNQALSNQLSGGEKKEPEPEPELEAVKESKTEPEPVQRSPRHLEKKEVRIGQYEGRDVFVTLVYLEGGTFFMGTPDGSKKRKLRNGGYEDDGREKEQGRDNDEGPVHEVLLDGFWMGMHEVTNRQFVVFLNDDGNRGTSEEPWFYTREETPSGWSLKSRIVRKGNGEYAVDAEFERHPATCVSWYGAMAFADWLDKKIDGLVHLPTEAQWEYACRAGSKTPFHFGGTISTDMANYDGNNVYGGGKEGVYRKNTVSVDELPGAVNAFGLRHMHGNVWEWCLDAWDAGFYDKEEALRKTPVSTNKSRSASRVLRGGAWVCAPWWLRAGYRCGLNPGSRGDNYGFRVSCSPSVSILIF